MFNKNQKNKLKKGKKKKEKKEKKMVEKGGRRTRSGGTRTKRCDPVDGRTPTE
jgi:hypothetical protein